MKNDWQTIPLGEILKARNETPSSDNLESGRVRVVSKIGFSDGMIQLRNGGETKTGMILIRPNDLVISGINAAKGAIAIYDSNATEPIAATIHYSSYIPNKDRVDLRFLWYLLRSEAFKKSLNQNLGGGIKSELKPKLFLSVPLSIPSLREQQRIVARIEELAWRVEEAQRLRREAIRGLELYQKRAIDQFLDSTKFPQRRIEEIISEPLLNGLSIPAAKIGSGVLFAKVGIVNSGVINPNETKLVDVNLPTDSSYWMKNGDIFVSRGNTPELVGRAAVYIGVPANCAMPDLLIRIRVNRQIAEPRFISAFFHSSSARQYIESQVTGTSPTMKKISQPKLLAMRVPLPPLAEQHRIVAHLDNLQQKVDELRRLQAATQKELDALMPSILAKAFNGEL